MGCGHWEGAETSDKYDIVPACLQKAHRAARKTILQTDDLEKPEEEDTSPSISLQLGEPSERRG